MLLKCSNPLFADEVDDLLIDYKSEMKVSKSNFETLVSSVEFVFPRWKGELAWAHAVMNGWKVAHTPAHTVPLPRSLMLLFVVHLVVLKMPILGVALYLQHCQGLRPSEVLGISISDIRSPGDDVGAPDVATIALGLRTGTKTKRAQFTIVKDKRAIALLRWAIQRSTGDKFFRFLMALTEVP